MNAEPEPIIIDRRHPAWVAAYAESIRSIGLNDSAEQDELVLRFSRRLADMAWLDVQEADIAERVAYEQWKSANRDKHHADLQTLAAAMFAKNYGALTPRQQDEVQSFLGHHEDIEAALAALRSVRGPQA